jgi:hypothetical protein
VPLRHPRYTVIRRRAARSSAVRRHELAVRDLRGAVGDSANRALLLAQVVELGALLRAERRVLVQHRFPAPRAPALDPFVDRHSLQSIGVNEALGSLSGAAAWVVLVTFPHTGSFGRGLLPIGRGHLAGDVWNSLDRFRHQHIIDLHDGTARAKGQAELAA